MSDMPHEQRVSIAYTNMMKAIEAYCTVLDGEQVLISDMVIVANALTPSIARDNGDRIITIEKVDQPIYVAVGLLRAASIMTEEDYHHAS